MNEISGQSPSDSIHLRQIWLLIVWMLLLINPSPLLASSDLESDQVAEEIKPFYVLTIPKSGTHLMIKLLSMLVEMKYQLLVPDPSIYGHVFISQKKSPEFTSLFKQTFMEEKLAEWRLNHAYSLAHFNMAKKFSKFSFQHPEYVKIIQIRDLRDACVSCAYHCAEKIESWIGPCSIADKIMLILTLEDQEIPVNIFRMKKYARLAVKWLKQHPDSVISRFEKLVGANGGGEKNAQIKQIKQIASAINAPLTPEQLSFITENLFGNDQGPQISETFRAGFIGSWKTHFNDAHQEVFKKNFGELQTALGYPL
ncbi:MAG: hypothetical protein ACH350_09615 [Parachlamydiaceae bacterium]